MSIRDIIHLKKNSIYLFTKPTGQKNFFIVDLVNIQNRKCDKFFVIFGVSLRYFSIRTPQLSFQKVYWTISFCLVERFKHILMEVLFFLGFFGSLWGRFSHSQKRPNISTNTYRTKLKLCELNSVGDTFPFEYKFGAWQM